MRELSSDIVAVIQEREFQNLLLRNKEMLADVMAGLKEKIGDIPGTLTYQVPLKRAMPSDQSPSEEVPSEKKKRG